MILFQIFYDQEVYRSLQQSFF